MTGYAPQYAPANRSNGFGLAGFITALVGIVSCGLLSPIGVILSAIGLRKEPRGFAIAGLVIGLLGSIWLVLGGLALGVMCAGLAAAGIKVGDLMPYGQTIDQMETAQRAVASYVSAHNGELPADMATFLGDQGLNLADAWKNAIRVERTDGGFRVWSAGPDGQFDSKDDVWVDSTGEFFIAGLDGFNAQATIQKPISPAPPVEPTEPSEPAKPATP